MRIAILALLPAVAALALVPRAAAAQNELHWKGKVAPGKAIEIKGVNGDVRAVASAGGGDGEVTAVTHARKGDPGQRRIEAVTRQEGATIGNGDIETDFPLMVTGRLGPRSLHGTIGSGGRRLALETVNGSIRLRKSS